MKIFFIIVAVISIIVIAFLVSKDTIVKSFVEKNVETITGLKLNIDNLKIGITRSVVNIKGLRLFNPQGFKDPLMLDMPLVYIDYNLTAIMKERVHLEDLRIHLKELTVVKNEKGELNLNYLTVVKSLKEGRPPQAKGRWASNIQIDRLHLKIDKALYKDYSKGPNVFVKEFDVNIDETYTHIDDPYELVSLLVVRTLRNTSISKMSDFDIGALAGTISLSVKKMTGQALRKTTDNLKEMLRIPLGLQESGE